METLLPKGGGLFQVEIDGDPRIALAQSMGFHLGIFSTIFRVLNFQDHFEALNDVFLGTTTPRKWPKA
jgi:hypothetical protein